MSFWFGSPQKNVPDVWAFIKQASNDDNDVVVSGIITSSVC